MIPWNPADMTLPQAQEEYTRLQSIRCPSTADLRRTNAVLRRIDVLDEMERRARPVLDAEKVAYARQLYAGGKGR